MIKIALDIAGGDLPAYERIKGLADALKESDEIEVFLVGNQALISDELTHFPSIDRGRLHFSYTDDVITMQDAPSTILKEKKNSSLALAVELVKSGDAHAVVSAGNTGAQMAASMFKLGKIKSIDRPAIAITVPSIHGSFVLLDAGANTDIKASHLKDFALMGRAYAKILFNKNCPTFGILNNGTEKEKGNRITKEGYDLLSEIPGFSGFIEGREMMNGICDVIVCDGFTGNIVLKTIEGVAYSLMGWLKKECTKNIINKIASLILKPSLTKLKNKLDYRVYGGALLLGVNGISIICHGSSDALAIKNAILLAAKTHKENLINKLSSIN